MCACPGSVLGMLVFPLPSPRNRVVVGVQASQGRVLSSFCALTVPPNLFLPTGSQDCSPAAILEGSSPSSLLSGRVATSPQVRPAGGWGWGEGDVAHSTLCRWSLVAPPGTPFLNCLYQKRKSSRPHSLTSHLDTHI